MRARTSRELGESEAGIFDAHLALLDDTDLLDQVRGGIAEGRPAEAAWADAVSVLEARAADIRSVGDQVLRALLGVAAGFESCAGILLSADLTPA